MVNSCFIVGMMVNPRSVSANQSHMMVHFAWLMASILDNSGHSDQLVFNGGYMMVDNRGKQAIDGIY